MKKLTLFLMSLVFLSCEEEDICVEGSTPRLVIENTSSNANTTEIDSIKIYRQDAQNETLVLKTNSLANFKIPLKLEESNETQFILKTYIKNNKYEDQLKVNYNYQLIYTSKACGFRVHYDSMKASLTPNFFKTVEVLINSLDNEAAAHLRLSY